MPHIRFRTAFILVVLILLIITALVALLAHWPTIAAPRTPGPEGGIMAAPLHAAGRYAPGSAFPALWHEVGE